MSTDVDEHETEPDLQAAKRLHQAAPRVTPEDDALAARLADMAAATTPSNEPRNGASKGPRPRSSLPFCS